jgi:hypothetical protein
MIWLIVAFALDRVQLKIGAFSYGSKFSGLGAIDDVLARKAPAPVAYRVLVPWLIGLVEQVIPGARRYRLTALYEPFKIASIAAALAMVARAFDPQTALLLAILVATTFYFDYWDWPIEIVAVAGALSGRWEWALVGGLLCALSRETAPLVPATFFLVTFDWYRATLLMLVVLCIMMAVRLYVGPRNSYWTGQMWRVNWTDLRDWKANRPAYLSEIVLALLIAAGTLRQSLAAMPAELGPSPSPCSYAAGLWHEPPRSASFRRV